MALTVCKNLVLLLGEACALEWRDLAALYAFQGLPEYSKAELSVYSCIQAVGGGGCGGGAGHVQGAGIEALGCGEGSRRRGTAGLGQLLRVPGDLGGCQAIDVVTALHVRE
jgi:hypothetical protein